LISVAIDEGSVPQVVTMVYDRNGNLVADGAYHFQYDAWGRLIQVSEIGTLAFDAGGEVTSGAGGGADG
jgi:hypothetical protein